MGFLFSQMAGKNVLITGGCGFLGSNLARKILELDANVTIFISPGKNRENLKSREFQLKFVEGDLAKEQDVVEAVKGKDYIFHFAWQTDLKKSMLNPKEDLLSDCLGMINLLEACKKENPHAKIIFTSTTTVIGLPLKIPANESHCENPLSVYDVNKLMAEKYLQVYCNNFKLNFCVLRLSNVFGEWQKIDSPNRGILNFMIGRALRGEVLTVYGKGDFIRDYCYVQNYLDAFILSALSEKTNGEVYVLGSGEGRTMNEVVEKIKQITESLAKKEVITENVPFPGGEHEINKRNFIADCSKFREATGWFPKISFDEGLKRTIEFYLKN
ncbi:MAG TPA: GDP-mannose 4,6-dehydratase [Candidatus Nanoarchaeia archaeon]|nr:GDP-mannose 4,6-dehydratase [Candidatus Nanoarchaeia archaeon]